MDAKWRRGRCGLTCAGLGIVMGVAGCDPNLFVVIPRPCGGLLGLGCRDGEFCQFDDGSCGAADQTGVCAEIPDACTLDFSPVCGCDGETYGNACAAAAVGVSVVREGQCRAACGGVTDAACPEGAYCRFPEGTCGEGVAAGECRSLPDVCTEIFAPVCGCDGQTYGNSCAAEVAGVSVEHEGSCENICGGLAGFPCSEGQFCLFELGTCGAADQTGSCMAIPEACTQELAPMCGCDGVTYDNECFANVAGVSILSAGECPPDGEPGPG